MNIQELDRYLNFDLEQIASWQDLENEIKVFDFSGSELTETYKKGFWLHGTGTLGVEIANKCLVAGIPVLGFTDNNINNQGKTICGLPVKAPQEVADHVVICVYKYLDYAPSIAKNYSQGFTSYAHLLLAFPDILLPHWCLVPPNQNFFDSNLISYKNIYNRISKPKHKIEFLRQIASRSFLGILASGQSDPSEREYLAGTLSEKLGDQIILDLGAYDGDTAIRFIEYFNREGVQVLAVEPDQFNFGKLLINAEKYPGQILPLNLLVGNSVGLFPFFGDGSKASNVFGNANQLIPGLRIDDLYEGSRFTRVKIDVEGFEKTVLEGALSTIATQKVSWAISTYHRPNDLIKLPDFFGDDYEIEVFSHSGRPWDTAYSFIPK
jgi:FkbM family methyltransferase